MSHPSHEGVPPAEAPEMPDMPSFAILVVDDLDRSIDWYVKGLGFWVEKQLDGPDGKPVLVHLRRAQYRDLLLTPRRDSLAGPRGTGVRLTLTFFDENEESLSLLAERAKAVPGGSVEGPIRTPWNTVDLRSTDPDGYTVVISGVQSSARPEWAELLDTVRSRGDDPHREPR